MEARWIDSLWLRSTVWFLLTTEGSAAGVGDFDVKAAPSLNKKYLLEETFDSKIWCQLSWWRESKKSIRNLRELSTLLSKLEFNSFNKEIYLFIILGNISTTYPGLTFWDLVSICSNRLVPSSDNVPKLQFVFLRKWKTWPLQVAAAAPKSWNYSTAEHWLHERPWARDSDTCLGKGQWVFCILVKWDHNKTLD